MKTRLVAAVAIFLACGGIASAHRLDEYLQAAMVSVEKNHVQISMRLIPGVAVSAAVIASIDSNGDGVLSAAEQRSYAEQVLGDCALLVDGDRLRPRLVSASSPRVGPMREGLGEIQLEFTADLPRGGSNRRLILENHHQNRIAAYLVNCLVPRDPAIRIVAQHRNETQSFYQLDYVQGVAPSGPAPSKGWTNVLGWMGAIGCAAVLLLGVSFYSNSRV
ncbi:MAG TPA: hypothetical protein VGS07_17400 [Thermoanaerobaculia bacterium]|jgi:hypothetical protein|nr:hypothetical protein [Thermoanaerobaculia bacterium]